MDAGLLANWLGFAKQRQMLISKAYGSVLEVAVGTGLNLPLYNATQISSYKGVDISPGMLSQVTTSSFMQNIENAWPMASTRKKCSIHSAMLITVFIALRQAKAKLDTLSIKKRAVLQEGAISQQCQLPPC